ncbi:MAG: flagellar basal body-associated FliL family protein [Treponema sp.]|nr:flagellar basal body-associated FliL family protein [Spirochaetales bacterium]MDY4903160.1 flagellar basal body-associated FliL family protein [Treponema sp.]
MADEAADDISGDLGGGSVSKKGNVGGIFTGLLKWILIAIAAIILVVTIAVIVNKVMGSKGGSQTFVPVAEEYKTEREFYDWYSSIEQIRTQTSDPIPASVTVELSLGYKKDDKQASSEITARIVEIRAFLRRYFAEKTADELDAKNEDILRQQIRDQLNDDILSTSRIRDVQFTFFSVVRQQ